jgi:quinoprotein glucose dehydrogenase
MQPRLLALSVALVLLPFSASHAAQPTTTAAGGVTTSGWPAYGGSKDANRYSALDQITVDNVSELEVAWTHNSGDYANGSGDWAFTSLQVTPIVTNGTLYYCTPFGRVFALDPETGRERWHYDPVVQNKRGGLYPAVCRGVSYWEAEGKLTGKQCSKRIIYGTRDAELIALDADSGKPCADFGNAGRVALKENITGAQPWEYYPTSPPYIIGDLAVIGAMVPDNDRADVPSGVVRAFNVRSGELAWAWEPVSEEYKKLHRDQLGNTRYHLGSPNVWAPVSGDSDKGLVFVPTGNPAPDLYGGNREGIDYYGSSVVALDASDGSVRWHFQTVHHDIWDYDVASQPTLLQHDSIGAGRPALVQATKMGHVFLLDRLTGEPLYPVEERPVPQGAVPGEHLSPTQPFPTHPPPLHLPEKLTADNVDGFVWFDRQACRREIAKYRSEGMFTPPSFTGSVIYPTTTGGINWGGVSIDPVNGILYVNQMHLAAVVQMIPRDDYTALNPVEGSYPLEFYPMTGTPYGVKRFPLFSPLGAPCNPRPWGSLTAVDLKSGEVLWREPLGTTRGQAPWPLWLRTGTPNTGGSISTSGKLVFIGATTDSYFRAFHARTGEELWRHDLPYTGNATPLTYRLNTGTRQFVVIAAGGHGWSTPGDAIIAFALPVIQDTK